MLYWPPYIVAVNNEHLCVVLGMDFQFDKRGSQYNVLCMVNVALSMYLTLHVCNNSFSLSLFLSIYLSLTKQMCVCVLRFTCAACKWRVVYFWACDVVLVCVCVLSPPGCGRPAACPRAADRSRPWSWPRHPWRGPERMAERKCVSAIANITW